MVLLYGPTGSRFLINEVALYALAAAFIKPETLDPELFRSFRFLESPT